MSIEFKEWPKIMRLYRPVIVTEKIDGTNAAVIVEPAGSHAQPWPANGAPVDFVFDDRGDPYWTDEGDNLPGLLVERHDGQVVVVAAQSRKRVIAPGKQTDNAGFAAFVRENAQSLADTLGEGYHYGEWYGKGIQSGYGDLDHKRFALFNVTRWRDVELPSPVETVPVLYEGDFSEHAIDECLSDLRENGSRVWPGAKAEGIVIHHVPSRVNFKVLCYGDELPKGVTNA